ncbi:MAG: hypothetical protein GY838_16500 [bacterium]|nr:hypothetical protein [bacterium]
MAEKAVVVIPVSILVVAMDDGSCDVSDTQIYDQMDVLNAAYQGTGFSFTLAGIDRTYNSKWSSARYGSRQASRMKEATSIDSTTTFNIRPANIDGFDTPSRSSCINVTEPGTGGSDMHMADIVVTRTQSGRKYYGNALVTIVNDGGAAVSGATVSGVFTGDATVSASGVTGTGGTVAIRTGKKYTGTNEFCFEVTGVTHASLGYDAGANAVTKACESGDVFRGGEIASPVLAFRNNPNPFNPMTVIEFNLAKDSEVLVRIYNARGHLADTPVAGTLTSGFHAITWHAVDRPSGI